ncbi:DoxX family membrane protein [Flavobacterium flavipallidum]|uniref:DoxX family membrane protein n=1 Tax=Flavobacterium flavipallidum TaxID=3139140 RepID=A0ABU9HLS0_9FLAO
MKIATLIVRTLMGAIFLCTSISYFLNLNPETASTGDFKAFQVGLIASTYLMPLAKTVEFLCGLSFVFGKFTTLANIVIFPVIINILLINYFLRPTDLPIAVAVFAGNLFLIYSHWQNYKGLFKMNG